MDENSPTSQSVILGPNTPSNANVNHLNGLNDVQPGNACVVKLPSYSRINVGAENKPIMEFNHENDLKSDSEAETIVLPRHDRSPSETCNYVKLEHSSGDDIKSASNSQIVDITIHRGSVSNEGHEVKCTGSPLGKRKRLNRNKKSGHSSLSGEIITSQGVKNQPHWHNLAMSSDSEIFRSPSPHHQSFLASQATAKPVDRALSQESMKNPTMIAQYDLDKEVKRSGKQQSANYKSLPIRHNNPSWSLDTDTLSTPKLPRLVSPILSTCKRSQSIQISSNSCRSLSQKKKRVPAPLQSAEFHYSDDSSTSGTSCPPSSLSRNVILSSTRDLSAKLPPHKKHVNSSGQTPLAVACARGKLELVKKRYEERPEDLNVPDNALNTPLHIASLEGWTYIVKFLLETGNCELDCVNTVKDTPLHDAIDNKNFEVVRLLLNAGANPCKPNQAGSDPLDLLNQQSNPKDKEKSNLISEIKKAVITAKEKFTAKDTKKPHEEHVKYDAGNSLLLKTKNVPRYTQIMSHKSSSSSGITNRKVGTARSLMKTTERVLYQTFDLDALRVAARDGDIATVSRVLDVRPGLNDAQTLYNAAKGGHDAVINILFALGDFDPDPKPIVGLPAEYSTPILAAIGRDHHLEVIKLFLGNSRFNPTRHIEGEKYYDLARRRGGHKWKEEVEILMEAFQAYENIQKPCIGTPQSPESVCDRLGSDHDLGKLLREDQRIPRWDKNVLTGSKLRTSGLLNNAQNLKSESSAHIRERRHKIRLITRRVKAETGLSAVLSDIETNSLVSQTHKHNSRLSPDRLTLSENEPSLKPRRKLVSGRELKDKKAQEKKRRKSVASTASGVSATKIKDHFPHKSSTVKITAIFTPKDNCVSTVPENSRGQQEQTFERYFSKNERPKNINQDSSTDCRSAVQSGTPDKRRRKSETSSGLKFTDAKLVHVEETSRKKRRIEDGSAFLNKADIECPPEDITIPTLDLHQNDVKKGFSICSTESIEIRNQRNDTSNGFAKDTNSCGNSSTIASTPIPTNEDELKRLAAGDCTLKTKLPAEILDSTKSFGIKITGEAAHQSLNKNAEQKLDEKLQNHSGEEYQKNQSVNLERLSQDKLTNLDLTVKERSSVENTQPKNLAQGEKYPGKKIIVPQESHRVERFKPEERERQELKLSKLPILLRWFQKMPEPKTADVAELFRCIVGYRYDTINHEATGLKGGDDQWMLSTHAAILLGEKDLQLSQYTNWERVILTIPQKRGVWSTCKGFFLLLDGNLPSLREQLPYETQPMEEAIENNKKLFLDLDLFFVKVTEFMCVVPSFPHLKGIEMVVVYRELCIPQSEPHSKMRWKLDPQCSPGQKLAPLPRHYKDGIFIYETQDSTTSIMKEPPSPDIHPRRLGLTRVYPGDPDYEEICSNLKSRDKKSRGNKLQGQYNFAR